MDIQRIDRDKENGIERDRREFGLKKRQKEIEVNRRGIETNIGGYTKNRQRLKVIGVNLDRQQDKKRWCWIEKR